MSVETAIIGQLDRMAKTRQSAQAIASGGTDFWDRTDAAGDETYENRVKGTNMTTLDSVLTSGASISQRFQNWVSDHQTYIITDLGLSGGIAAYLNANSGRRVSFEAAEIIADLLGSPGRLPVRNVFPKGTRPTSGNSAATSGMHMIGRLTGTAGAPTWAAVDGAIDTTRIVGAAILIVNEDATPGPTDVVMRATLQDATTKDITVALTGTGQHVQSILGSQAIGAAGAASGQTVVPVAATAQFKAGEYVLIRHDDTDQEIAQIASVQSNTSLTMEGDLIRSYVENDLVLPLFTTVAWVSGTLTDSKKLAFYAYPDRAIAL